MTGNDPFGGYRDGDGRRRPWFGRRPDGYAYGPRTWQGWLVMAVLVIFAITVAGASRGQGGLVVLALAPLVVVPFLIALIQRR